LANDTDKQGNDTIDPTTVKLVDPATGDKVTTLKVTGEGTWEVMAGGKVRFTPDNGFTGNPTPVQYTVADTDGHTSKPGTVTVTYDGTTPPNPNPNPNPQPIDPPTVAADADHQGGMTITPNAKASTLSVSYTDETGQPKTITVTKDASGQWAAKDTLPKDVAVDATTGKVTLPPNEVKDGSTVVAKNADAQGTESSEASAVAPNDDGSAPTINAPAIAADTAHQGGVVITPDTKATTLTVEYTDETGQPKTINASKDPQTQQWKADGTLPKGVDVDTATGKVTLPPEEVKDGSTVKAHNGDGTNTSADASMTAPDDAVTPPNPQPQPGDDAPVANADSMKGTKGQPVTVDVLANDTDKQGNDTIDPTTVKLVDPATGDKVTTLKVTGEGTWEVMAGGKVRFTPDNGFTGNPTPVQYTVADTDGHTSKPGTVTVTYDGTTPPPAADAEVASITGDKAVEGTALHYDVALSKAPAADTEVTFKLVNGTGDVATDLGKEVEVSTDGGNTWTKVALNADGTFKVTVPAGSTNGVKVSVPTTDDSEVEGDETIRLEGKTATQQTTVVGEGTIVDNDASGNEPTPPTVAKDDAHKGGMVITPNAQADKLEIDYTNESDQPQKITLNKDPASGEWKADGTLPQDVTVDATTGKVTLPPKEVKDGSTVTAKNSVGNESSVPAKEIADSNDVTPPTDNPTEPLLEKGTGSEQGGVSIKPQANTDKVVITYKDESDQPHTVTVTKDPQTGKWSADGLPQNGKLDADSGEVKLPPEAIKDESPVTAVAHNGNNPNTATSEVTSDVNGTTPPTPQPGEPTVTISGSESVNEGEAASYTVKLSQPSDKDVTVTVTLTHKGTDDADFATAPDATKTLTIKAGETEAKFTLDIAKDGKFEGAENYNLTISNPQGAALGKDTSVDTKVVDIDTPPAPTISEGAEKGSVDITPTVGADKLTVKYIDENDKPQTLTVSKDPATGEWKGDNLPQGVDVDAKTGKVTLTPGAVKDNSDVVATNSGGSETSPEAKGQAGAGDNTPPNPPQPGEPTVTISGSETVEEGGTATYKVTLSQPSDKDVTVKVTLKHNETDDSDFNPAPEITKTLTIKAGQTSAEFTLHPVDDQKAEDKETYSLTLSEPQGAKLGDQTSVTTAITDKGTTPPADDAQVKAINAPTAEEGQPLVYEVTVDTPKADTTVTLTLKSGTATLGTDTGTPIETSTDGGQTWQTVTPDASGNFTATVPAGSDKGVQVRVPTVVDTEVEGKETLTLEAAAKGQTTPVSGEGTITDAANNTPPQAPQIADGEAKGSVTITPDANADSLKVSYEDENGDKHTLELHKENGKWVPKETLPTDVKLDETSGKVTLEPNAVKDGSDVSATNGHGGADSDAATHQAGTDEAEVIQGNATSEAIAENLLGFNGEFYGYNDNALQSQIDKDPTIADRVRYHADDNSHGNLGKIATMQSLVDGRNGETVVGTSKSAKEGAPDARFKATNIQYGMDPEVNDNLGNNQKTAAGESVTKGSAMYQFLEANSGSDAGSLRAEAGVPNQNTSGMGYTTDSMVRIAGKVYFKEGYYDFSVKSDDGFRMRLDDGDTFSMEYNGNRSIGETLSTTDHPNGVYISEGFHNVEMLYWEQGSYARLHMQYKEHS
ncbi:MAG: hypothetical protein D8H94_04450, partial [Cardiobacterium sp.]